MLSEGNVACRPDEGRLPHPLRIPEVNPKQNRQFAPTKIVFDVTLLVELQTNARVLTFGDTFVTAGICSKGPAARDELTPWLTSWCTLFRHIYPMELTAFST